MRTCSLCPKKHYARGLCEPHYADCVTNRLIGDYEATVEVESDD